MDKSDRKEIITISLLIILMVSLFVMAGAEPHSLIGNIACGVAVAAFVPFYILGRQLNEECRKFLLGEDDNIDSPRRQ